LKQKTRTPKTFKGEEFLKDQLDIKHKYSSESSETIKNPTVILKLVAGPKGR